MDEMRTRYILIKVILNEAISPAIFSENGEPENIKIIRANSDNETLTVDVKINKISGWQGSDCVAVINGALIDDINAITKVNNYVSFVQTDISNIEVYAGYDVDSNGYPPLVYSGAIYMATPDFNNENRSRPLTIHSLSGWEQSGVLAPSASIKEPMKLVDLFKQIAKNMPNYSLTIEGADDQVVQGVVYLGSAIQQLQQACADYGFALKLDDKILRISPLGQPMVRQILTISPDDNLLGYPIPQNVGVSIRVRFNPAIQFGQIINLDTSVEAYKGQWYVNGMSHHLTNRGRDWVSVLQLNRFNILEGG